MSTFNVISPIDQSIYAERPLARASDVEAALTAARAAQASWRQTSIERRQQILMRAVDYFVAHTPEIAAELTWQMGRPIAHSPGEMRGLAERARYMLEIAPEALAPLEPAPRAGF